MSYFFLVFFIFVMLLCFYLFIISALLLLKVGKNGRKKKRFDLIINYNYNFLSYEINLVHWAHKKKNPTNFFHLLDKVFCLLFVCFINTFKLFVKSNFSSVHEFTPNTFTKFNVANLIRLILFIIGEKAWKLSRLFLNHLSFQQSWTMIDRQLRWYSKLWVFCWYWNYDYNNVIDIHRNGNIDLRILFG